MSEKPKKSTGEIGVTNVMAGPDGQIVELIHTELPTDKESLEDFFALRFVKTFNETLPLGLDIVISGYKQNTTADLDFDITCPCADYVELAELNPRSERFGRSALKDGNFNVYEYSKWIFSRIIKKKSTSYGPEVAGRTILLLYATHWQFYPCDALIECIRSHIQVHGCTFSAVFFLWTDGTHFQILKLAHPYIGPKLPKPSDYSHLTYRNIPPGQNSFAPASS
jgi:hypothetical protein